jgi:deoxyribonuclease-4
MLNIGAHIKKESGHLLKTLEIIKNNDGNALQLFVSNPRSAELSNVENYSNIANELYDYCNKNSFQLVIHTPYTINLAKEPKANKRMLDLKDCYWINLVINQLLVSDIINSIGVVIHVGKYTTNTKENAIEYMRNAIQYIIKQMKNQNIKSKLIIETPAGAGTELLTDIDDFISFYNNFSKDELKYLGICIDTAHIWSSGYDINEYYKYISKRNLKDILVIHLNNSKKDQGSNADMHETIFDGKIPIKDLEKFIINLKNNKAVPIIILEKPSDKILKKELNWIKNL